MRSILCRQSDCVPSDNTICSLPFHIHLRVSFFTGACDALYRRFTVATGHLSRDQLSAINSATLLELLDDASFRRRIALQFINLHHLFNAIFT